MVFEIPSDTTTIFEDIQQCVVFVRKQGVIDTAGFSVMLSDLFKSAVYAARQDGVESSLTVHMEALIDNNVLVTVIDSRTEDRFALVLKSNGQRWEQE